MSTIRQKPSQLPATVVRSTYDRMVLHCTTEGGLWACRKNGARVHFKVNLAYIYDRQTGALKHYAPVGQLYCSGCDQPPRVVRSLYTDQIMTLSV